MKCHLEGSPSSLPPCAHTQVFSAAPSGVATSWTECSPKGESPGGKLATGSGTSVTWPASGSGRWIIPDRVPSGLKWPFLMSLNIASKTLSGADCTSLAYTLEAALFVWWCPSTNLVSGSAPYLASMESVVALQPCRVNWQSSKPLPTSKCLIHRLVSPDVTGLEVQSPILLGAGKRGHSGGQKEKSRCPSP